MPENTDMPEDEEVSGDGAGDGDPDTELEALREENRRLADQLEQFSDSEAAVRERNRGKRLRRLSIALAVIGALLLPPTVLTVWLRNRVLDTNIYVETVEPLASDPDIQKAVANRISLEVTDALDLESEITALLPEEAAPIAPFIASGADSLIDDLALKAVESDQFQTIWETANREGHDAIVAILTGEEGDVVSFSEGQVTLNLGGLVDTVLGGIDDATGLDLASKVPDDAVDTQFVLFESEALADAQGLVSLLNTLTWVLLVATLACLGGALLAARDKRLGFRRVGISLSVSMVLTLVLLALGRQAYLNALSGAAVNTAAAESFFDIVTNYLRATLRAGLMLGLVCLFAAWIIGPSRAAVRVRSWGSALSGAVDTRTGDRDLGPVPRWIRDHIDALTWTLVVVAALVIVFWNKPTGIVILVVAGIAALLIGVLRLVAAAARDSAPPVEEPSREPVLVEES